MVNSEFLSDIFQSQSSEEDLLKEPISAVSSERSADIDYFKCVYKIKCKGINTFSTENHNLDCNHGDNIIDSKKNKDCRKATEAPPNGISESQPESSFELHLSPSSEEGFSEVEGKKVIINLEINEESSSDGSNTSLDNSMPITEQTGVVILPSENAEYSSSADMFADSPQLRNFQDDSSESQELQCSQEIHEERSPSLTLSPEDLMASSSVQRLSEEDNREQIKEWSQSELTQVSQSLKIRRKQVKRLLMAVIRKRQMEDETLEAFKKRLKRF